MSWQAMYLLHQKTTQQNTLLPRISVAVIANTQPTMPTLGEVLMSSAPPLHKHAAIAAGDGAYSQVAAQNLSPVSF